MLWGAINVNKIRYITLHKILNYTVFAVLRLKTVKRNILLQKFKIRLVVNAVCDDKASNIAPISLYNFTDFFIPEVRIKISKRFLLLQKWKLLFPLFGQFTNIALQKVVFIRMYFSDCCFPPPQLTSLPSIWTFLPSPISDIHRGNIEYYCRYDIHFS